MDYLFAFPPLLLHLLIFSHDKIWLLNADGCSEWPLSFLRRSLQRYHFEWSVMATLLLIQSITSSYLGRRTHTLVVPQFVNKLGRPMNGRGLFNLPNWLCPATRTICGAHIIVNMLMGSGHPTTQPVSCHVLWVRTRRTCRLVNSTYSLLSWCCSCFLPTVPLRER